MPNIDRDDENATRYEIPKPDIDEQIANLKAKWTHGDAALEAAIATLEAHKHITEASEVTEPVAFQVLINGRTERFCVRADVADELASKLRRDGHTAVEVRALYGPDLLAAYHKALAERDAMATERDMHMNASFSADQRAETAERQLAELREKHDRLVARLQGPVAEVVDSKESLPYRKVAWPGCDVPTGTKLYAMSTVAMRASEGGE